MLTDSHTEKESLKTGEHFICEKIMRSLPEWFGIEEFLFNYDEIFENRKAVLPPEKRWRTSWLIYS